MNSKNTCIRITSQWIKTCMCVQHVDTHSKLPAKWEIMHELHIHSLFHHVKCVQKHFRLKVIWTDTWNYHAGYFTKYDKINVIKSWKSPRINLPSAIYQKSNEKENLSALCVGGSFSTNGIWKNIWNINTAQNNTSVRNVKKNSHTGRLLMITRKFVPTNFRTGHRDTIGYQPLSFFSVFKVIVLFYVSFSFTFILLSCLFSFSMYVVILFPLSICGSKQVLFYIITFWYDF